MLATAPRCFLAWRAHAADRIAEMFWTRWGGQAERHPADWAQLSRAAGLRRNAQKSAGATVCLAFIQAGSTGASHTAARAEVTDIPIHRYEHGHC